MDLEGRKAGKGLTHSALTQRIIAAAIAVHRELGPGFLENVYEEAMAIELSEQGIFYERQKAVPVIYRNRPVGEYRLDLLVEHIVILELKAVLALENRHFAVVRSYLKACALETGLLMNFAAMPLTIRRVGREHTYYEEPPCLHEEPPPYGDSPPPPTEAPPAT